MESIHDKKGSGIRILLHPEESDLPLEVRASNFYQILKLTWDAIQRTEDKENAILRFFDEAFKGGASGGCLEIKSRAISSWFDINKSKSLIGDDTILSRVQLIAQKTKEQNITSAIETYNKTEHGQRRSAVQLLRSADSRNTKIVIGKQIFSPIGIQVLTEALNQPWLKDQEEALTKEAVQTIKDYFKSFRQARDGEVTDDIIETYLKTILYWEWSDTPKT